MARTEHPTDGRTRQNGTTNVVPLRPRQWLDSKDELVPIGAVQRDEGTDAADVAPPSPPDDGHASTWLGTGEQTIPIAPTVPAAPDFWGEDAADLQHAMEAPGPAPTSPEDAVSTQPPRRRSALPRVSIARPHPGRAVLAVTILAAAIGVVIAAATTGSGRAPARHASRAPSIKEAARTAPSSARVSTLRSRAPADRAQPLRHRSHARPRPHTAKPLSRIHQTHKSVVVSAHVTSAPASTPAPTYSTTAAPAEATSVSSPTRAGPSGPDSLIAPGSTPSG